MMKRLGTGLMIAWLAVLGGTRDAFAEDKPKIGIMKFEVGEDLKPSLGMFLYETLTEHMVRSGKYTVVDWEQIDRVMTLLAKSQPNVSEEDARKMAVNQLGISRLYLGSIVKVGEKQHLSVKQLGLNLKVERVVKDWVFTEGEIEESIAYLAKIFESDSAAAAKLEALRAQYRAERQQERADWAALQNNMTEQALAAFLKKYPAGEYSGKAGLILSRMRDARLAQEDSAEAEQQHIASRLRNISGTWRISVTQPTRRTIPFVDDGSRLQIQQSGSRVNVQAISEAKSLSFEGTYKDGHLDVKTSLFQGSRAINGSISGDGLTFAGRLKAGDIVPVYTTFSMRKTSATESTQEGRTGSSPQNGNAAINPGAQTCFIATAAYGSPWERHVLTLRRFREQWLLPFAAGRWFVAGYYRLSPPVAAVIVGRSWARAVTRAVLFPVVVVTGACLGQPWELWLVAGSFALVVLGVGAGLGWRRLRRATGTLALSGNGIRHDPAAPTLAQRLLRVGLLVLVAMATVTRSAADGIPIAFTRLRFAERMLVDSAALPRLVMARTYDNGDSFVGVLGPAWRCYPLDAGIEEQTRQGMRTLVVRTDLDLEDVFVEHPEGGFFCLDPLRRPMVGLRVMPENVVMEDRQRGVYTFVGGRLVSHVDPGGNRLEIARSPEGIPARILLPSREKRVVEVAFDAQAKRLMGLTAANGERWQCAYDDGGRLVGLSGPRGYEVTYHYAGGRLTGRGHSRGLDIRYGYDAEGRLAETDAHGRVEKREYAALPSGPSDFMITITDPVGRVSKHRFLDGGRREVVYEKDGNRVEREYDENGLLIRRFSFKDGGMTAIERNASGQPTAIMGADRTLTAVQYDDRLGLPMAIATGDEQLTLRYNSRGLVSSLRTKASPPIDIRYNRFGAPSEIRGTPNGHVELEYSDDGTFSEIRTDGKVTERGGVMNLARFLIADALQQAPLSRGRSFLVGELSRVRITDEDLAGGVVKVVSRGGRKWACEYDVFGNLTGITEDDAWVATLEYDNADRLLGIRYSTNAVERWAYDDADNVALYANTDGRVWTYEYDLRGLMVKRTTPEGEEHSFEYDERSQLTGAAGPLGKDVFEYDADGRLAFAGRIPAGGKEVEAVLTCLYGGDGRLEEEVLAGGVRCKHEFNVAGNMETLQFQNTRLTVHYDAQGRCRSVYYPGGIRADYSYAEAGGISRVAVFDEEDRPAGSLILQYDKKALVRIMATLSSGPGDFKFGPGGVVFNGRILPAFPLEHFAVHWDGLDRIRRLVAGNQVIEVFHSFDEVIGIQDAGGAVTAVRSKDRVVRAIVSGDHILLPLYGGLPGKVFVLNQTERAIELRDFPVVLLPLAPIYEVTP